MTCYTDWEDIQDDSGTSSESGCGCDELLGDYTDDGGCGCDD